MSCRCHDSDRGDYLLTRSSRVDDIECRLRLLEETTHEILRRIKIMGAREDAADARQAELIELVREALIAKDTKIAELQAALVAADADKAAALEAASDEDAARQEAVNAALEELSGGPAPEPAPEPEPTPEPAPEPAPEG